MKNEFKEYESLVHFLGETLGSLFEVTLFDITEEDYPVVCSVNSHKDIHEKLRDLITRAMHSQRVLQNGYLPNCHISSSMTSLLKASVYFITGSDGKPQGALCLVAKCDIFVRMLSLSSDMLRMNDSDFEDDSWEDEPWQGTSETEASLDMIREAVVRFGVDPARMSQNERIDIIFDLYDMGVFDLKGAVSKTAEELQISIQSVYRYINKIKRERGW